MPNTTNSGIRTAADGTTYIPASQRADGTTRKALRVRPGFTPQEDVQTYKSRNAEAWKQRGTGGVPGAEEVKQIDTSESRSKNAKRREAAKRNQADSSADSENALTKDMNNVDLSSAENIEATGGFAAKARVDDADQERAIEAERQKKIRNFLKKLGAIKELKDKKARGEKLSPDQLMKLSREQEIVRDLKKLDYEDAENLNKDGPIIADGG